MPAHDILQIIVVNVRVPLRASRVKPFAGDIKTGSAVIRAMTHMCGEGHGYDPYQRRID